MSVYLLKRSEIIDNQWDDFIIISPQSIFYANSWYLDVVSPDWCALVMEENGRWQAVMPLPVREKWFMKVIKQPFFCQLLGVFAASEATFQEATLLFLQKLPDYFRYVSIYSGRFFELFPSLPNYALTHCSIDILLLDLPYTTLKANFSADRKKNLKRANKFHWHIETSQDINPLIELFQANHADKIEGGVAESAYDLLRRVFEVLKDKKSGRLMYAIKDGKIEAGALFAIANKRIIYLFNAASPLGRQGDARTLLIDWMIQQYANSDYVFDFESPEIASIKDFYQSFGTKKEDYQSLHLNKLPFPLKQIQQRRRKLSESFKLSESSSES